MKNFENAVINLGDINKGFFWGAIKTVFILLFISIVFILILKKSNINSDFIEDMAMFYPEAIVILFKMAFSFLILMYDFFYDFNTKTFNYQFPKEMLFSSWIVGILALYELLSGVVSIVKLFIELVQDNTK